MVDPWPTQYDQHDQVRCLYTFQPSVEKGHTSFLRFHPYRTFPVQMVSGKLQLDRIKTLPPKAAPVRCAQLPDTTFHPSGIIWNTRAQGLCMV